MGCRTTRLRGPSQPSGLTAGWRLAGWRPRTTHSAGEAALARPPDLAHIGAVSQDPLRLFDPHRARARRARAAAGLGAADFLARRAAADLAERLDAVTRTFPRALDLAARGAVLAEAIAARPAVQARIGWLAACDSVAASLPGGPAARFVADIEAPPLAPESIDLILSVLALHWVNDLPGLFVQARRALRPDGLFLAAFLGGATLMELRQSLLAAEAEICGGAAMRVSPFADLSDAAALLQRAGFALPVADCDVVTARYDHLFALVRDLRAMGETAAFAERAPPLRRAVMLRAAEIYAQRFSDPDGRIRATFEIVTVTGWAPHESQQKPLRPGSARARLATALGVQEQAAGDKAAGQRRGSTDA